MSVAILRELLIAWYDRHKRDLPWRGIEDPWAIWVSEVMAQQTRVDSVVDYWRRFMSRYPTPAALARADLDAVLVAWAGLGYYARARNLHRAARQVVERHGGEVPEDPQAFRTLAGVGPYTCGAVLSIAFGQETPAVDGNVIRVLCRLDGIDADPTSPAVRRRLWARAGELVCGPRPGDLNQALMELGAMICTPRSPACLMCPVSQLCRARAAGDPERLPLKRARPKRSVVHRVAGLVHDAKGVWLGRRPDHGLLAGLWDLPAVGGREATALAALGLEAEGPSRRIEHGFTHRVWAVAVWRARGVPAGGAYTDFAQIPYEALGSVALGGPALKALRVWKIPGTPQRRGSGPDQRP